MRLWLLAFFLPFFLFNFFMQQDTKTALAFCGVFLGILVIGFSFTGSSSQQVGEAVALESGRQIVALTAKGGYSPSVIEATAGVPTDIRISTNGTYDCSSSIVIPALGYRNMLPATGIETISLTAEQATGTLEGMCSMGMYSFEIVFE
jgi:P-type Cu+ transporter